MIRKQKSEKMEKEMINTDNLAAEKSEEQEKRADTEIHEANPLDTTSQTGTARIEDVEEGKAQESKPEVNCEELINEWKDKYLRLSAEFDNYRKRTLKEKIDLSKYAGEEILKGILPVVDDFDRGIKNMEEAKDLDAVKEGVLLIYNKFKDFLTQKGIKEIESMNTDFNTDFHDAVTNIPVQDKSLSGKIVDVIQKGYLLNDKVVRHAKVVIGE